jgi:hypothetical protein
MDINSNIFLDPRSDDDTMLGAISQMTPSGPPASLWTQVANDPSYRPFHRAAAIYELFKRHVAKPVTLEQTARLLAGGRWLLESVIEKIESMAGEIPVQVPAGGTAFVIRLAKNSTAAHPGVGIYLALDHSLDAKLLRDALMSRATDPSVGQIRIVDFALFPKSLVTTNS